MDEEMNAPPTKEPHMVDVERIEVLQAQVLDELTSINLHLVELNGSVAQNARDVAVAQIASAALQVELAAHRVALAVLEERNKFQAERHAEQRAVIAEQKEDTKALAARVLDLAAKFAALTAAVGIMGHVLELF